ncbi:hypothetical protein HDU96_000067 [Phlyctochytrium bullatum]|nr:hypothetical protein HDU96_000067 [Phlyctochytrium bullatum]
MYFTKLITLFLLAAPAVFAKEPVTNPNSKTFQEAAKNAADGKCAAACTGAKPEVYKRMIDSDASGTFDTTGLQCRPVVKANLPEYKDQGPFVAEALAGQNIVQTPYGPLDDADRFLINGVRIAGLWEEPASREAEQVAACPRTKEIAALIKADHLFLDDATREIALELKVPITDQLPDNIARFMQEMACMSGIDYDTVYAQRLRQAHGNIFLAIAQIRTRTRNDLIREFATIANRVVMSHIERLESTGLVNFNILPPSVINKADPATSNLQVSAATVKF